MLHVASLAAVTTGTLAHHEAYMMTAETGDAQWEQWMANLDQVATRNPAAVVASHEQVENGKAAKFVAEESAAAALVARMVEICPGQPPH